MLDEEDSVNIKKRKPGGHGQNEGASPVKTSKLEESLDGSGESSQNITQSQTQTSQGSEQAEDVIRLQSGDVFNELIEAFSKENLPKKITYNGIGYNLTELYDEFWTSFYNSSQHSRGCTSKIPHAPNLKYLEILSLARIIKRGWEDERYWPNRLSPLFLESCLFQEEAQFLTAESFLTFVEPEDKELILNSSTVDKNVLDIFNKYCKDTVFLREDIKEACMKAAIKLMIVDMNPIINIWREYLKGLMPVNTFSFLMKEADQIRLSYNLDQLRMVDMLGYKPPHKLWHTFFLGWPEDKIRYYKRLLQNDQFGERCEDCDWVVRFDAQHFISACEGSTSTTRLERHDAVLRIIETKLCEAIKRGAPYFANGTDWKVTAMYKNNFYRWPKEDLGVSFDYELYPHLFVYTKSPMKKFLLIEHAIRWEPNITTEEKAAKYYIVKEELGKKGFEVEYWVHNLGSRGVVTPELYNLLNNYFAMEHSEISKTLEEISQQIIHTHYLSYKAKGLG